MPRLPPDAADGSGSHSRGDWYHTMYAFSDSPRVPVIDFEPFESGGRWRDHVARQVDWASSQFGFFQLVGHRLESAVPERLLRLSSASTVDWDISVGGFPAPQAAEVPAFPGLRDAVADYLVEVTSLAHHLMSAIGRGLSLGDHFFYDHLTANAVRSLRISRSSPAPRSGTTLDEVAEPGLLTVLYQDEGTRLRFKHRRSWVDVPHVPHAFLVGVGASLARLTAHRYLAASWCGTDPAKPGGPFLSFSFRPQLEFVTAGEGRGDAELSAPIALASRTCMSGACSNSRR